MTRPRELVAGVIEAGEWVMLNEIAQRMGVSRGVARDAIYGAYVHRQIERSPHPEMPQWWLYAHPGTLPPR